MSTQGPWTVSKRTVSKRPATIVVDADNNEVCEVYACPALIAAAPDLLAALQKLVRAIDRAPANFADGLADQAREVILRATASS